MSFSRSPLVNQFKELIVKAFKLANKTQIYISDIAHGLQSTLDVSISDPTDPALVITQYLLTQLQALKESNAKASQGNNLILSFFRKLAVVIHAATQLQFQEIAKRILEPQADSNIIANLWKSQSKTYSCYCGRSSDEKYDMACYKCGIILHPECFWPPDKKQKLFECPVCYMKHCYPHKPVDQIFFLGYIPYQAKEEIQYKAKFYVDMQKLNLEHVSIRCVRLNHANRFQMTFPENCRLMMSNQKLREFEPLPATSPLKRRNDEQVYIKTSLLSYLTTLYVRQKHTKIQQNPHFQQNHLIMVASIKPPRDFPKQIYENFKKERLSIDRSKQLLQEYMSKSINECEVQKINVSLQCQYFGTQITCPARSKHCTTHYQPFDLNNFVKVSLTADNCVQKWRCPICKKRAYDLFVDDYLQSLIKSRGNLKEITFSKNAEPIFVEQEVQIDEEFSDQNLRNEPSPMQNQAPQQGRGQKSALVIDIEDDDIQNNGLGVVQEVTAGVQNISLQNPKPPLTKNFQSVIEIIDSEQNANEHTEQVFKRTIQDRINVESENRMKEIKKIPALTQVEVGKLQQLNSKTKPRTPLPQNKMSSKILDNENIRTKLRQIFAKDSTKQKVSQNLGKETINMVPKVNPLVQQPKTIQKQVVPTGKEVTILDVDSYEQERAAKLKALKEQQMILLNQAKKTLSKQPMTKSDQITFNLICRQIQKIKLN